MTYYEKIHKEDIWKSPKEAFANLGIEIDDNLDRELRQMNYRKGYYLQAHEFLDLDIEKEFNEVNWKIENWNKKVVPTLNLYQSAYDTYINESEEIELEI